MIRLLLSLPLGLIANLVTEADSLSEEFRIWFVGFLLFFCVFFFAPLVLRKSNE